MIPSPFRRVLKAVLCLVPMIACASPAYRVQLDTLIQEYDGLHCWAQARAAAIPRKDAPPELLVTLQKLKLTGSDVFSDLCEMRSQDFGKNWSWPEPRPEAFARKRETDGTERVVANFWPKWHAASGRPRSRSSR